MNVDETKASSAQPQRNRRSEFQHAMKRGVDITGSLLLIVLFSPVFILVSLLLLLTQGPPLIYRRTVVGIAGEFDAFKFRTMVHNADKLLQNDDSLRNAFHQSFKLRSDPRVTLIGKLLRKFSVDEFPQLFNVLAGQMSLVGPRMITRPELDKYGTYRDLLLTVKPGLTGHWQVHGRQEVSYAERVRMDIEYIRNWSLSRDITLLFQTPLQVIRGKGAY